MFKIGTTITTTWCPSSTPVYVHEKPTYSPVPPPTYTTVTPSYNSTPEYTKPPTYTGAGASIQVSLGLAVVGALAALLA